MSISMSIEKFWGKIKDHIGEFSKVYYSVILIGIITHITVFTNKYYNEDDIYNLTEQTNQTILGRWLWDLEGVLFSHYSIPIFNGICALFFLLIASIIVCKIFNITDKKIVFLMGCLFVTFPVLTCSYTYMFGSNMWTFSICLAILFDYFTLKSSFKGHNTLAILALIMSISLYQINICIAAGLFWVWLIGYTVSEKDSLKSKNKDVLIKVFKYFSIMFIALLFYYVTVKISLKVTNGVMASYQNINNILNLHIWDYFIGVLKSYYRCLMFLLGCFYGKMSFYLLILHICITTAVLVMGFKICKEKKFKISLLLLVEIFMLPLLIESVEIIAATAQSRHMLMRFASIIWYIIPLLILNQNKILDEKSKKHLSSCITVAIGIIIIINFYFCNLAYLKCELTTSNMEALSNRVATSIEMTDGYIPNETKVWIDSNQGVPLYKNNEEKFEPIANMMGVNNEYRFFELRRFKYIMSNFLYMEFKDPTDEEIERIKDTDKYKNMNAYPLDHSIEWIDDILVVKMAEKSK